MATVLQSLWPKELKVDVKTPLAILREQAQYLALATKGILRANVEWSSTLIESHEKQDLVVEAPACKGIRITVVTLFHQKSEPYPVMIESRIETMHASTDDELIVHLRKVLNAPATKAILLSLIAKSNEVAPPPAEDEVAEDEDEDDEQTA